MSLLAIIALILLAWVLLSIAAGVVVWALRSRSSPDHVLITAARADRRRARGDRRIGMPDPRSDRTERRSGRERRHSVAVPPPAG
jgi:hypothetical protein